MSSAAYGLLDEGLVWENVLLLLSPTMLSSKCWERGECHDYTADGRSTSKSAAREQNKPAVTDHAILLNHVIDSGGFSPRTEEHRPPSFASDPPLSWPPMIFCKDNTNVRRICISKVLKSGQICGFH